MSRWPNVALEEVVAKSNDWIQIDPDREYNEVTVRNRGQGAVLRRVVTGAEIAGTRRMRVHHRQFIVSRIDARHGSSGVIPSDLEGAIVTNDFPVFDCDEGLLLPEYLGWYSKTPRFVDSCRHASEGSTNRVRLKEPAFLEIAMPLPPIDEQRRVVEKLNRLATAQTTSQRVRKRIATGLQQVSQTMSRLAFAAIADAHECRIDEVCTLIIDCLHSNPVYSDSGVPTVRSPDVGWGELLLGTARTTSEDEYVRRTQRGEPHPGDIVLVREGGGTGKAGIVCDGNRLSLGQRVMLLRPNEERILPEFLLFQWLSPLIQADQIAPRMKGSASPHLNIGALKQFRIVCPPLERQQTVVEHIKLVRRRIARAEALLERSELLSDALLPAAMSGSWE